MPSTTDRANSSALIKKLSRVCALTVAHKQLMFSTIGTRPSPLRRRDSRVLG